MPLQHLSTPSPAELMSRIRCKIEENNVVLHPSVQSRMEHLRDMKRWQSKTKPDDDYPTVTHTDLINALRSGVVVDVEESVDSSGWKVVVNGTSADGWLLTVTVFLPSDDDDSPLMIMSFEVLPEETEPRGSD